MSWQAAMENTAAIANWSSMELRVVCCISGHMDEHLALHSWRVAFRDKSSKPRWTLAMPAVHWFSDKITIEAWIGS